MDLSKRILKIVRDNVGVAVFTTMPQPTPLTGFAVVYNTESYVSTDPSLHVYFRTFLIQYYAQGHGFAAYRRSGRVIFGNFSYFAVQGDAEAFAQANKIQHVYNLATNTSINLGAFDPSLPGDGVADE